MFHLCFVNVITGTVMVRACFAMIRLSGIHTFYCIHAGGKNLHGVFTRAKGFAALGIVRKVNYQSYFAKLVRHLLVCSDSFSIPLAFLFESTDENPMNSRLASPFHIRYRNHHSRQCTQGIYLPFLGVHKL